MPAQNIAFQEVGPAGDHGRSGLAGRRLLRHRQGARCRARRGADGGAHHLSVRSRADRKVRRRLQDREAKTFGFDADFQVESYLRHQGLAFTERFDANSYLYITRAMELFRPRRGTWRQAGRRLRPRDARFCLVSFDTDWLYPTSESRQIVHALNAAARRSASWNCRRRSATTASCSTCPRSTGWSRGFLGQ
jgi:homoserine O-acetyltransferase